MDDRSVIITHDPKKQLMEVSFSHNGAVTFMRMDFYTKYYREYWPKRASFNRLLLALYKNW